MDSPYDVKYGRDEELVIDGDCHVAWLVIGGGHGADGVAQVDAPQQEEKLGCRETEKEHSPAQGVTHHSRHEMK